MYALLLSFINLSAQQRNRLHLRGHLDILYFITFAISIGNIYSFYLKFGTNLNTYYSFGLLILSISFILVIITIMEPDDDLEGILSKPNSEVWNFWEHQSPLFKFINSYTFIFNF